MTVRHVNIPDIIFQFIFFAMIAAVIIAVVLLIRSYFNGRKQLDRIERQIKELSEKIDQFDNKEKN
ncbi:DUF1049 domain-containing protein [Heyndrickxia acidiproducens]|uniref:DUF1049 domain-containing protein n=1 Tax=Heyndrickxia acidiproducens TaxID=1121084 RepID=UPI00035DA6F0|nr:DUF1049 domain-containing protein [Heyndrickxia acidiproducens]